jgi:uncharacterized protein involved in exopolysaccharide biosynthesis
MGHHVLRIESDGGESMTTRSESNRIQGRKGPADQTLRELLAPIFRYKSLLGYSLVGFLILAIAGTWILSRVYQCDMEVLVNRERMDPTVTAETINQTPSTPPSVTEEDMNSEVELMQSGDLLTNVVLAVNLQEAERTSIVGTLMPKQSDDWYVARAVNHLAKKLDIQVVKKTNMIQVKYKSSDPQVAYNVMNKLSGLYMEKHLTVHRPTGSYEFFTNETEKYRLALAKSEADLSAFGNTEGVVAPDVQRTNLAQVVMNSLAAYHTSQQAIAAAKERIAADEKQMQGIPSRSSTQHVSNAADLLLQGLKANLLTAQIKRTQLAMKYDPSYPLVQEADKEVTQTEAAIADAQKTQYVNETTDRDPTFELLREDMVKAQSDLASEKATSKALEQSMSSIQAEMVKLDKKAVKQQDLLREVKADEANYLLYLGKREQERTTDALDQKRIANIAIAVPPVLPILPAYNPLLVLVISLLLAVCLSVGTVFIADYFDASFRTPAEVLDVLRIPVLASVPKQ